MNSWNRIEQAFKHRQLRFGERLLGMIPRDVVELESRPVRRILLVRQHDQLGDFLLSTPVFRALRLRFPHAHISVVARKYTAALAQHHSDIDEVVPFYEHGRDWSIRSALRFGGSLRRGCDLAIVLNTVSHSFTSDLIARASGAPFILGPENLLFGGTTRNFFYNLIAPVHPGERHQCERNLDIVRHIGADVSPIRESITLTRSERAVALERLHGLGRQPSKPLVALHPGAGKPGNRWPVESFAELGRAIYNRGAQLLIIWGPAEEELGSKLRQQLGVDALVSTDPELRGVAALLSHASVLICNDTGVMHLAASVGTPLVAIFGPTDPKQWKPPGESFIAVRAADGLCATVTPQEILAAIKKVVANI